MYRKKWMQKLVGKEIGMVIVSCGSFNCLLGIEVQANLPEIICPLEFISKDKMAWTEFITSLLYIYDYHVNVKMMAYEDCQISRKQVSLCSVHSANYLAMGVFPTL